MVFFAPLMGEQKTAQNDSIFLMNGQVVAGTITDNNGAGSYVVIRVSSNKVQTIPYGSIAIIKRGEGKEQ